MVYCRRLKDGKCSYTNGTCIISNPKTIEDYKLCPQRLLAKDYDEMDMVEKAFHNSIENKKKIDEFESRIIELEKVKPVVNVVRRVISVPEKKMIIEQKISNKKKGGFWNWLLNKK